MRTARPKRAPCVWVIEGLGESGRWYPLSSAHVRATRAAATKMIPVMSASLSWRVRLRAAKYARENPC